MRNGVLSVFGEIISRVYPGPDISQDSRTLRNSMFNKLCDHAHDVNAFVRSKVLQIWYHLCQAGAIPLSRQRNVLPLVVGRLRDKSSQVRKNALQLLTAFVTSNPFAPQV